MQVTGRNEMPFCIHFQINFLAWNVLNSKVHINSMPTLIQIMAWHRAIDKSLPEPIMGLITDAFISLGLTQWKENISIMIQKQSLGFNSLHCLGSGLKLRNRTSVRNSLISNCWTILTSTFVSIQAAQLDLDDPECPSCINVKLECISRKMNKYLVRI